MCRSSSQTLALHVRFVLMSWRRVRLWRARRQIASLHLAVIPLSLGKRVCISLHGVSLANSHWWSSSGNCILHSKGRH